VSIDIYSPAEMPLPIAGEKVNSELYHLLKKNLINFHPSHKLCKVSEKTIEFDCESDKENIIYDLIISIPPHKVPSVVKHSNLLNDNDKWISVDIHTLQTKYENVYAIGDVTDIKVNDGVSVPKAGIFAENQAKIVCEQIINDVTDNFGISKYEGKGFCFMEIGNKKAGYIDTNFYSLGGPIVTIKPPSTENYLKKIEFEKSRINDWI